MCRSCGAVVSVVLSERKVAGSIPGRFRSLSNSLNRNAQALGNGSTS